jgi:D-alanine-D-alanine ligase
MRKQRVLVLMHESLIPPDTIEGVSDKEMADWKMEYDVCATLENLGHDVKPIGLSDDLTQLRREILLWKPHVAFNLLEEFHNVATYDQHVVSFLELMRQPYTGCNPRGLMLSHDKTLSKKILHYHRILTPKFASFQCNRAFRAPSRLNYPLFVKSATEDASFGIAQASVVHNVDELRERVRFVHEQTKSDALVEEFIEGRELYVGVMGNQRLQTFPIWELIFGNMPDGVARIATRKVKWDHRYQEKHGIDTGPAKNLPPGMESKILRLCKRIYRLLYLSGYARMDLRLTEDGRIYVLEANANPNISFGEDLAESAELAGISYQDLLERMISLAKSYKAEWMH